MALGSEPSVEAVRAFLAATDGGARAHPALKNLNFPARDRSYGCAWMPFSSDGSLLSARNTRRTEQTRQRSDRNLSSGQVTAGT